MGYPILQSSSQRLWAVARRQHGVIARHQLLALGFSAKWVKHRIVKGRLHPVWRGVYAIGRPQLTQHGRWMAAVLSCGREAVLCNESAGALWEILAARGDEIVVCVPYRTVRRRAGIVIRRRASTTTRDVTRHLGIPVTSPVCTLIDLGARLERRQLEAAINEADKRDLVDPETLRSALDGLSRRPGVRLLRERSTDERSRSQTRSSSAAFCRSRAGPDFRFQGRGA
jgi:hypothetical protein